MRTSNTPLANKANGISFLTDSPCIFSGYIQAATPTISVILKMLLPITFPRDTSALPSNAAIILTVVSGKLVPKETIVNPITIGDILINLAILDRSEEHTSELQLRGHLVCSL